MLNSINKRILIPLCRARSSVCVCALILFHNKHMYISEITLFYVCTKRMMINKQVKKHVCVYLFLIYIDITATV